MPCATACVDLSCVSDDRSGSSLLEASIPEELLIDNVLPYIGCRIDLANLSAVSKRLRKTVLSRTCVGVWDKSSRFNFQVCIDGYCPTCRFKYANGSFASAIRFLSQFPAKRVQIHCFLADIPHCLAALASVGLLQQLALSLTSQRNSLPLQEILSNAFSSSESQLNYQEHEHERERKWMRQQQKIKDRENQRYVQHLTHRVARVKLEDLMPHRGATAGAAVTMRLPEETEKSETTATATGTLLGAMPPFPLIVPQSKGYMNETESVRSANNMPIAMSRTVQLGNLTCELLTDESGRVALKGLQQLKQLTLNSAHLNQVKLEGRARLLDFIGGSLEHLSFRHLSPPGVFSILPQRCPQLRYLRVDRAQTMHDLHSFVHDTLEELELRRCNFVLSKSLLLPALLRLRFSAAVRLELLQIKTLVQFIPKTVVDLSVEIPSSLANQFIVLVSKALPGLQHLTLEGSHETDTISARALLYMGRKCRSLQSIQVRHAKSVHALSFHSGECMAVLCSEFPALRKIRVRFDNALIPGLRQLLSQSRSQCVAETPSLDYNHINSNSNSNSSRNNYNYSNNTNTSSSHDIAHGVRGAGYSGVDEVVLWQRRRWMQLETWQSMEATVASLLHDFPGVAVSLEDV